VPRAIGAQRFAKVGKRRCAGAKSGMGGISSGLGDVVEFLVRWWVVEGVGSGRRARGPACGGQARPALHD
jgi:hypothetical protein